MKKIFFLIIALLLSSTIFSADRNSINYSIKFGIPNAFWNVANEDLARTLYFTIQAYNEFIQAVNSKDSKLIKNNLEIVKNRLNEVEKIMNKLGSKSIVILSDTYYSLKKKIDKLIEDYK